MRPFTRPTDDFLYVERAPIEGACPECGAAELARYPVLSEGGWWNVTKCQACLYRFDVERGNLLGSMSLLSDDL